MEDRTRLSRWLDSVLEGVGVTERLRRLHRQTAVTQEILHTIELSFQTGKVHNVYYCGSSYEGSVSPALASDKDIIICASYLPVVLDAAAATPGLSFLMVRDSWTYPGYVKLQRVWDGQPLYDYHGLPTKSSDVDNTGRICRKHINIGNMHGPADKRINEDGVHYADLVFAFRCDEIQHNALEWIMRPRPYGWPSRVQLQTMSTMGCMFVGVGHFNSGEKEIEFRMSYTLQERMLMSSLNTTQHKVYIVLKMIKKSLLESIFHKETLTSYHFKMCILYAVQMSPAHVWTQDNLINCLVWCLKLMLRWLETNNCPSFLTRDQNLFMKEGFKRLRIVLLIEMRKIIESGHQFLYMIQIDNVGAILRNGDWRMYRDVTAERKNDFIRSLKLNSVMYFYFSALCILRFMSNETYDPLTLTIVLENLKNARHINNNTVVETQSATYLLFPWLHLHMANGLASFTQACPDRGIRERVMKLADFHFHKARGIDLVNERLAVASVLYTFEKYEECSLLLHLIESDITYHVMRVCPCTGKRVAPYYDIRDKNERNKRIAKMSIRQCIQSMIACCVVFLPSAAAITPEPIHYEMQRSRGTLHGSRNEGKDFWFDWAVVDPQVYLYFMQYLVNIKLHKDVHRDVARDNLRAEIVQDDRCVMERGKPYLPHKDTAYNLLGWIYMQEERWAEAYECFLASWKVRPFHNAAKYHMRDLIARLAERRVHH